MYHGVEYFWAAKNPAFYLLSGVPFGLTGLELLGWLNGPGAQHWDAIQAPFNIKPFGPLDFSGCGLKQITRPSPKSDLIMA